MTTPTSLELREYNTNKDTQLPILEPTPEALVSTPAALDPISEASPAAVDSTLEPTTEPEQPAFTNSQTDQPEPGESNLVDELIDTSVRPAKKAPT